MKHVNNHGVARRRSSLRATRALRGAVAAMLGVAAVVAASPPASAAAGSATIPATSGTIGVSWTVGGGDGSSQSTPIVYEATIDDCTREPAGSFSDRRVTLNAATFMSSFGKWFTLNVTCTVGENQRDFDFQTLQFEVENSVSDNPASGAKSTTTTFQLTPNPSSQFMINEARIGLTQRSNPQLGINLVLAAPSIDPGSASTSGGSQGGPSPVDLGVAAAVKASNAAGVEGTSAASLVRGGAVVPVVSSLASGVGPRGGVVLEAEGLSVSVASAVGARPDAGVVVPEGGALECSLCGDFVPGVVVEAWINSDPRLTAAVRIPADAEAGDCHVLAVPTGAPLDGGEPIEAGAHTLQLRMHTAEGFAVLSTGITVGSVTPSGVPAGEGSPLSGGAGVLLALLGVAGAVSFVRRREVLAG